MRSGPGNANRPMGVGMCLQGDCQFRSAICTFLAAANQAIGVPGQRFRNRGHEDAKKRQQQNEPRHGCQSAEDCGCTIFLLIRVHWRSFAVIIFRCGGHSAAAGNGVPVRQRYSVIGVRYSVEEQIRGTEAAPTLQRCSSGQRRARIPSAARACRVPLGSRAAFAARRPLPYRRWRYWPSQQKHAPQCSIHHP